MALILTVDGTSRMEQIAIFEEKVVLAPLDFHENIQSFDRIILNKLKTQLERRCTQHGYVVPDSLSILSRSLGYAEKGRFTSDFLYYVKAQGRVIHPPEGFRLEGEVLRKNKMGMYVVVQDAIKIMIPRDLHLGSTEFDEVEIGDRIEIEIKKSRFQVNDTHILSIGQFIKKVGEQPSTSALAPLLAQEEEGKEEGLVVEEGEMEVAVEDENEGEDEDEGEEEEGAAAASDEEEEEGEEE